MATSINLSGITFPNSHVSADDDGVIQKASLVDGVLNGCQIIRNSSASIAISPGRYIACGKEIQNTSTSEIDLTFPNLNGYVRLKLVINLNDNQSLLNIGVDYANSIDNLPDLNKGDIYMPDTPEDRVYEMPLVIWQYENGALKQQESWHVRYARARSRTQSVTLKAANWTNNNEYYFWDQQSYPGDNVICSYDPDYRDVWLDSGVYLKEISPGVLKFGCDVNPTEKVVANLIWL